MLISNDTTRGAFVRVKVLVTVYAALSAVVLGTVAVLALGGQEVTSFLWGRSAGVLASALVTLWLTGRAARGARWAYQRVRIISVVMPVAIIAVDLIPGVCPPWFLAAQAVCAVAVAAAAFAVNGSAPRAAFAR